jgi:hypothetical protein
MTFARRAGARPQCPTSLLKSPNPPPMARIQVRLCDVGLAMENLRYGEPADDGAPQFADTVLVAGVVIPPIVRPGRKGEEPSSLSDCAPEMADYCASGPSSLCAAISRSRSEPRPERPLAGPRSTRINTLDADRRLGRSGPTSNRRANRADPTSVWGLHVVLVESPQPPIRPPSPPSEPRR